MASAKEKGIQLHEACIKCGGQPEVHKGKTYWTAHCPNHVLLNRTSSTPMLTKGAALEAWDADMKQQRAHTAG